MFFYSFIDFFKKCKQSLPSTSENFPEIGEQNRTTWNYVTFLPLLDELISWLLVQYISDSCCKNAVKLHCIGWKTDIIVKCWIDEHVLSCMYI